MRAVMQGCEIGFVNDEVLWRLVQSCHICAARDVDVCNITKIMKI